jgi:hypothetical protein
MKRLDIPEQKLYSEDNVDLFQQEARLVIEGSEELIKYVVDKLGK